ncbi:MAG: CDP-alcohol phosphatidyltransferase family protein [Pseudomonadales bacterium]
MWLTWANLLTLVRVLLVLPTAFAIGSAQWSLAAACFGLAVLSDLLDGPLARALGHDTALGGLLDHATDALYVTVTLAALGAAGRVPLVLPVLVIAAFIQYTLDSRALAGEHLRTSWLGRCNGIAYFVLVGAAVLPGGMGLHWPGADSVRAFAWLLVATTGISMADRLRHLFLLRKAAE